MKLETILKTRMGKKDCLAVTEYVLNSECAYEELLSFVEHGTRPQAMKASWVMAHTRLLNPSLSLKYQDQILRLLQGASVGGVRRELLRCLEGIELSQRNEQLLLNHAWLGVVDMQTDFAVRYLCLRVLRFYAKRYPEIHTELNAIREMQLEKTGRFP